MRFIDYFCSDYAQKENIFHNHHIVPMPESNGTERWNDRQSGGQER